MIHIISFQPHHTQQIVDLIINIQQNEFQVPVTLADQPDLLTINAFYQQKRGDFWVAMDGDVVVGTIALIDCGGTVGCIRKMFVKAEYRGKEHKIAQRLLDNLQDWATTHLIENLYLGTVEKLQAAIAFYKRNGFTAIEKSDLPTTFPIMPVDTHFFEKKL